jgi:hypothetical protein
MFDAGLAALFTTIEKAVRCIGASRKPRVSLFRRDWRTKTGVSAKLAGPLPYTKELFGFG